MRKFIKLINILLIWSCLLGACFFGFKILQKQKDYKHSENTFQLLDNIYNDNQNSKFTELASINRDFKGWITVKGTNISYPVTQTTDNEYYLKHDFYKKDSPAGTVFMDFENKSLHDENSIIYAHYMRNKTLFHNLELFKDENFFNNNKEITFETKDAVYKYEIFSVHIPKSNFNYLTTNFSDKQEYGLFLEEIQKRSLFKSDILVTPEDRILTLSTCSYEFKDARTVVHAVLKEENIKR